MMYVKQTLRVIPAVTFVVLPFFLFTAPARTLTGRWEARQTPRAAAVGVMLWLTIAYMTFRMVGVA